MSSVQSFSQNENVVNTSKELLKFRYWTLPLPPPPPPELYPWPRVRKCFSFIIYSVPKTYFLSTPIGIQSNKWKESARNKSTFIATKYLQNVIRLKQNFLNFFIFVLSIFQFHLRMLSKHLKRDVFILICDIFIER